MQRLFSPVHDTGKLNFFRKTAGLHEIFWLALTVFDWFWVLLFESKSPLKNTSTWSLIRDIYVPVWPKYMYLHSSVDILKLVIKGNFGLLCDSGAQTIHLLLKFSVEYWINLKLPVIANFKRS